MATDKYFKGFLNCNCQFYSKIYKDIFILRWKIKIWEQLLNICYLKTEQRVWYVRNYFLFLFLQIHLNSIAC